MNNQNHIEQINQELENLAQKRKEIYSSIRAVDRIFNGSKNICVMCGLFKEHVDHRPEDSNGHEYIPSIWVGSLQEKEIVYSIGNVADLYITNEGLRFETNDDENENVNNSNSLPSNWNAEVRLEVLSNLDIIIEGVLNALKLQSERLKIYDEGIEKVNSVLQSLKELA